MPFRKRISEIQRTIDDTLAEISKLRVDGAGMGEPKAQAKVEKLLTALAKLKAERLRLMAKQRLISN